MTRVTAILPAAGKGRRFGTKTSKLFFKIGGKPVLYYTLKNLSRAYPFAEILVAADPDSFREIARIAVPLKIKNFKIIAGGATRAESVLNALKQASDSSEWALVHDAARPLVTGKIVKDVLRAAQKTGGAITAVPATATVKRVGKSGITGTEDRQSLFLAQTPQVFKRKALLERYRALGKKALSLTDEASFFDGTALRVQIAEGAVSNLKITTPEDAQLFRFYLQNRRR